MRKFTQYLAIGALGLAGLLWAAPPAAATGHGVGRGFNGHGFGGYGHGGYGFNNSFYFPRYNFYPAQFYVPVYPPLPVPVAVAPPVVPAPVLPNFVPAAADPCLAPADTYGLAPAGLSAGYTPYFGSLGAYGGCPLYYNSLGFHAYNVRTNGFVFIDHRHVGNALRVRGFEGHHFAAAGFRGAARGGRGFVGNVGHASTVTQKTTTKTTTQTKTRGRR